MKTKSASNAGTDSTFETTHPNALVAISMAASIGGLFVLGKVAQKFRARRADKADKSPTK